MSTWRENVERVREVITHSRTPEIAGRGHLLLDALTAQIEELEGERERLSKFGEAAVTARVQMLYRAEVAERALAETEQIARQLATNFATQTFRGKDISLGEQAEIEYESALEIARAALAQSDPPEDAE